MSPSGEGEALTIAVQCPSEDDTLRLGARLGEALLGGDVVFAEGKLGAGKTCLIRGICSGLGFSGRVRSPSFAVVNEYRGRRRIYHMDLYRIPESSPELEDLSRQDVFGGDAITLVEWGEKLRRWGVRPAVSVKIHVGENEERRLEISFESAELASRAKHIGPARSKRRRAPP